MHFLLCWEHFDRLVLQSLYVKLLAVVAEVECYIGDVLDFSVKLQSQLQLSLLLWIEMHWRTTLGRGGPPSSKSTDVALSGRSRPYSSFVHLLELYLSYTALVRVVHRAIDGFGGPFESKRAFCEILWRLRPLLRYVLGLAH